MPEGEVLKLERLRKALTRSRLDFDDIVGRCRDGRCQFHDTERACAVTAIHASGDFLTCYVVAVAGVLAGVPGLAEQIEAFARRSGCQTIEMDGRFGWSRVYRELADGFKPVSIKYRKAL